MAQATIEQNGQATNQGEKATKEKRFGMLPTASGGSEVIYKGRVIQETTWAQLPPRRMFSVSPDGSHPYYKISKSSYVDLVTEEVTTSVPSGTHQKVYRISLAG